MICHYFMTPKTPNYKLIPFYCLGSPDPNILICIWNFNLKHIPYHPNFSKKRLFSPAAVVVTFFLCWAPYHAQRLYYFYGRGSDYYYVVNEWLYYLAGCFYYFSATANPLLYNLMSVKYRNGFRRTFCGQKQREYSSISRERQQSLCNPARPQQV